MTGPGRGPGRDGAGPRPGSAADDQRDVPIGTDGSGPVPIHRALDGLLSVLGDGVPAELWPDVYRGVQQTEIVASLPSCFDPQRTGPTTTTELVEAAVFYATVRRWRVLPLSPTSKLPCIPSAHREGDPLRGRCKGECGRDGHA